MVKQNMVDVVVFAARPRAGRRGAPSARRGDRWLVRQGLLAAAGGVGTLGVILGAAPCAAARRPGAVFYAMYPFRLQASAAMQQQPSADRMAHLPYMLRMWAATGAPLVIAAFLVVVLLRRSGRGAPHHTARAWRPWRCWPTTGCRSGPAAATGPTTCCSWSCPSGLMAGLLLGSVPRGRPRGGARRRGGLPGRLRRSASTARVPAAGVAVGDVDQGGLPARRHRGQRARRRRAGEDLRAGLAVPLPLEPARPRARPPFPPADRAARRAARAPRGWSSGAPRPTRQLKRPGPGRGAGRALPEGRPPVRPPGVPAQRTSPATSPSQRERCWLPLVTWNQSRAHHRWLVTEGATSWHH